LHGISPETLDDISNVLRLNTDKQCITRATAPDAAPYWPKRRKALRPGVSDRSKDGKIYTQSEKFTEAENGNDDVSTSLQTAQFGAALAIAQKPGLPPC